MTVLRIESISKSYGRLRALDDVSFEIRSGEILGLIGPNGAGKTTLFECLSGQLPRDAGRTIESDSPSIPPRAHEILFYLPDAVAPWPHRSVEWGLDYMIGFFGGRADLREDVIRDLALQSFLGSSIGSLSKGQRKRALLAFALLAPQPVLLIDEPFDGLDLKQTRDVAAALRGHALRGRTLFLSIHQIADAARLCDRFVLLSGGRVRGEGTLAQLRALAVARGSAGGDARADNLEEVFLALT